MNTSCWHCHGVQADRLHSSLGLAQSSTHGMACRTVSRHTVFPGRLSVLAKNFQTPLPSLRTGPCTASVRGCCTSAARCMRGLQPTQAIFKGIGEIFKGDSGPRTMKQYQPQVTTHVLSCRRSNTKPKLCKPPRYRSQWLTAATFVYQSSTVIKLLR